MRWRPVLSGFLIVVLASLLNPQPAFVQEQIALEVISATSQHLQAAHGRAMYYVVAEVRNPSEQPVRAILARLTAYRADGSIAGETKGYALVPILGPGERGPVAVLLGQEQPEEIARHDLSVVAQASEDRQYTPDLFVLGGERIWELPSRRYLLGELVNRGPETIGSLVMVVGLYDSEGRLRHVSRAPALVLPLGTGQRTPFRIELPEDPTVTSWRFWYVASPFIGHPIPLAVRVASAETDDYGRVAVTAVVTNLSSTSARDLRVVAILRDAQGRIVSVGTPEPLQGVAEVRGFGEATLRLFAEAIEGYTSVEVRAASTSAQLLPPNRFGLFVPMIQHQGADASATED